MGNVAMRWVISASAAVFLGVSAFGMGSAGAQPVPSPPPPPAQPGSTTDDLTDMVMDVIEEGTITAPGTTPVPAPPP
jgi:hypothetical protein